ncbi:MAG: acetylxylan esterase, partial [Anaerolineae bacterium]|nr:acetylxylan esterase [Anaerolineae bacterium]
EEAQEKIAQGWERFEAGGRTPLQARGVQLARMGCVVFQYDMVGYADSLQLTHKRLGPREHMNTPQDWGLSSPMAEHHLQSLMMLQTWNSVRSLDFLLSLPDIDAGKVGVEGHSGGGTQTFILAALDARPHVLFPAVMVGTAMQGGCIC